MAQSNNINFAVGRGVVWGKVNTTDEFGGRNSRRQALIDIADLGQAKLVPGKLAIVIHISFARVTRYVLQIDLVSSAADETPQSNTALVIMNFEKVKLRVFVNSHGKFSRVRLGAGVK